MDPAPQAAHTPALSEQCRALSFWILWFEDHKRYMSELRGKERAERARRRQFKKIAGATSAESAAATVEDGTGELFQ
jgi:hypothetical protein